MYEQVFNFSSRPFTSTPFVKHYFSGDSIDHSLGQAKLCIDRASGPVMVVGGAGTGKSLLLALLADQYHSQFNVVNLACGRLEQRKDLLQSILFELKQPYQGMTDAELRFALMEYLNPGEHCPDGVLLLIDEAHLLSQEILDEVRLITNFIREGEPRVRLVLAGNQRLEENLAEPKLESFNQRIAARCYLSNMTREETSRYVVEHIERAGGSDLFDQASLKAVHEVSDGCPRLVNQVCDHALILAATRGESVISDQCVLEAWSDVQSIPGDWAQPATQPDSVSDMQNDESWTVIEFGQLDDSDQPTDEGTVYDFANSQSETESVDESSNEADPKESAGETEATETEATETEHSFETESTDVVAQSEEPEPAFASEQNDDVTGEDEDLQPTNEVVDHDLNDMEAQLNAVFGTGLESTEPGEEKEITDMEAEQEALLDQVETSKQDAHSIEEAYSIETSSPASEQLATAISGFSDEPSDTETDTETDTDDGSYVETAMSDAAETETDEDGDDSPTHHSGDEVCEIAPEPSDTEYEESPSLESPDHDAEHHDTGLEDDSSNDVFASEDCESSADLSTEPQPAEESIESEWGGETDDPFAEEFVEEEHLVDRFAPFVAHQNHSSLSLTSSDLAMIRPLDADEHPSTSDTPESFAQDVDTLEPLVSSENAEPEEEPEIDEAVSTSLEIDSDLMDECESTEDSPVVAESEEDSPEPTTPPVDIIEADADSPCMTNLETDSELSMEVDACTEFSQQSGFERPDIVNEDSAIDQDQNVDFPTENPTPQDHTQTIVINDAADPASTSEQGLSTSDYEAALQAAIQQSEDPSEPSGPEPVENESTILDHDVKQSSAEIERQAEEILHRLGISQNVSCETEPTVTSVTSSSIDDSGDPTNPTMSPPASEVDPQATIPLVAISEPTLVMENEPTGATEFERQTAAIDETQQILNEILAQKNLLASQRLESEPDSSGPDATDSAPVETSSESLDGTQGFNAPESTAPATADAAQGPPPNDDREMIIVNQMEEPSDPTPARDQPVSFSSSQISKGRAERMDYQQLFDRLRDISNSQE